MTTKTKFAAAFLAVGFSLGLWAPPAGATAKEDIDAAPAVAAAPKRESTAAAPKVQPSPAKVMLPRRQSPVLRNPGVDITSGKRVAGKVKSEQAAKTLKSEVAEQAAATAQNAAKAQTAAPADEKVLRKMQKEAAKARKKAEKAAEEARKEAEKAAKEKAKHQKQEESKRVIYNGVALPADFENISIFGSPAATKAQAVAYIKACNKKPDLACSVEDIVKYYWEEAGLEGIRPDLALCQALVETGVFAYGGDVKHKQNNFCGLGTTGGGVRGASFKTPQLGVRAHIQHLLAYASKAKPKTKIIDPRYDMAHKLRLQRGLIDKWYGLNGTWAMGGYYCQKIMVRYVGLMNSPGADKKDEVQKSARQSKNKKKKESMRERVEELLKERH